MTRPPKLTATLNQAVFEEACAALDIPAPKVVFREVGPKYMNHGQIQGNLVTIALGNWNHNVERLLHVRNQIALTLLHELRHARQYRKWPEKAWELDNNRPYQFRECERDANTWADENLDRFKSIVTVGRKHFTRLPG